MCQSGPRGSARSGTACSRPERGSDASAPRPTPCRPGNNWGLWGRNGTAKVLPGSGLRRGGCAVHLRAWPHPICWHEGSAFSWGSAWSWPPVARAGRAGDSCFPGFASCVLGCLAIPLVPWAGKSAPGQAAWVKGAVGPLSSHGRACFYPMPHRLGCLGWREGGPGHALQPLLVSGCSCPGERPGTGL